MENQVIVERVNTTITGTIEGTEVRINYDREVGKKPTSINASCNIAGIEPMQNSSINVSLDSTGRENINMNGTELIASMSTLVVAMSDEVKTIFASL